METRFLFMYREKFSPIRLYVQPMQKKYAVGAVHGCVERV